MRIIKTSEVVFADDKVEKEFDGLDEDDEIKKYIKRAIRDIQINAFCGIQIPKKLFQRSMLKNLGLIIFGSMICQMDGDSFIQ